MSDFLEKIDGESTTSRYQQQRIPEEENNPARIDGKSKGQLSPDSLIDYNSCGGDVDEKDIKSQLEAGEYGKVRVVTETHSGHVILVDETKGNERIYVLHPNGSYINIEPKLKTEKTESDHIILTNGDMKCEVSKNLIEFIHENHNIKIYKDENVTIDGNKTDNIGGDLTINVSDGDLTINVSGNTDLTSDGPVTVTAPTINLN